MRQAILVRNCRTMMTSRALIATAQAGSAIVDWDASLDVPQNYAAAAKALAHRLGWQGSWIGGELPDSSYAFVELPLWQETASFTTEES